VFIGGNNRKQDNYIMKKSRNWTLPLKFFSGVKYSNMTFYGVLRTNDREAAVKTSRQAVGRNTAK
jgi:hypothetical protein